jgi:YgiT-type zinc finger domain-containing protein
MKKAAKEPCDLCDGELHPRRVRVVRSRARKLVIIDNVPAMVCNQCGTKYYDASAVRSMEVLLRRSRSHKRTIKVPVTKFEVVA